MTLQQMRYFVKVADYGSISETAKRLFAAPSSISAAVRTVEEYYGVTAFVRTSKGVTLTAAGKELVIEFNGILNRLYYLDLKYEGKKGNKQSLFISAQHHIFGMDSFMSMIKTIDLQDYHTGFHECKTSEVFTHVEKGWSDLGLIFFDSQSKGQIMQELRGRGVVFNHIAYRTAHVYLADTHPLASNKEIRGEELEAFPFITYDHVPGVNSAYTEMIIPYYKMNKVISVSDRAAAYSLMRHMHGFVIGSGYHTCDLAYRDILAIPLCEGATLELGWIVRNNYILSDAAQEFLKLLKKSETQL